MIHDLSVVVLPEIHFKEVSVHSVNIHMTGKLGIQLLTCLITTLVGVVRVFRRNAQYAASCIDRQ